jgi:hypothetical protein
MVTIAQNLKILGQGLSPAAHPEITLSSADELETRVWTHLLPTTNAGNKSAEDWLSNATAARR